MTEMPSEPLSIDDAINHWNEYDDMRDREKNGEADSPSAPADRDLLDRIARVARTVPIRLGPNALAMAQRGESIILNMNEAQAFAEALAPVLPEPRREFDAQAGLQRLADALHRGEGSGDDPAVGLAAYEAHRLTLSETLGLGTGAPWHAIYERAADLRRMADEAQPLRSELGVVQGLRGQLAEPAPQTERVAGGRRLQQQAVPRQPCTCGQPGCEYCDVEDDAEPEAFGPEVVAYRHPTKPRALLCRQHGDGRPGLTPVEADDLPDGGLCDVCDVDVLIPQAGEGR